MPLPSPLDDNPPPPNKLTGSAHAAILDDTSVDLKIRIAVLHELENATDVRTAFETICFGEELCGPEWDSGSETEIGRAMALAAFERGLVKGWFGSPPMDPLIARSLIDDVKLMLNSSVDNATIVSTVQALLDPGAALPPAKRVTWYYRDQAAPSSPLQNVGADLAHRLALPSVWGKSIDKTNAIEFVALAISVASVVDPRLPRFTDCGALDYLEVWRPGGLTAPWIRGLKGLDETVGPPTVLGQSVSGVRIVSCYES